MSRVKNILIVLCLVGIGAALLLGGQWVMHKTSSTEFCVSCHSMSYAQQEWEGSSHFANAKGVRAECADCHIPQESWHYLKAKVIALKDLWYEATGKIDDKQKYEVHRAEMAQRVWNELKANDSATCRSCHSFDAMDFSQQTKLAKQTHREAQGKGQTCIDCHKGIVHFLPEIHSVTNTEKSGILKGGDLMPDSAIFAIEMVKAAAEYGGDIRLMPYAKLTQWQIKGNQIQGVLHGWQQAGAESILYLDIGKRISVALVDDEARSHRQILQTKYDKVTDSEWQEVSFMVNVTKEKMTSDLAMLNQYGDSLNQTYCSGCHAPIGAKHYTANQWISVVNSMKDRTSMSKDEVRAVTIYLQRNAKDIVVAE
ncbi:nitrate reductase [Muribacter muris]|uniref:Cytochrome c-type protein n=1 Tax=Muribacter muris TaxID=67855 RepID=A0A4Y9K9I2_9PAST|nr:NapC/NirT family cytochrome c [Muribacter muris]MBF0783972.1 NapC/NirT family cytochrome c [Muribacter muris]MBF0827479.1 NapC/NirT family cytochrome c [Muribacter muris]TFV13367.1 nitrate reductase [Muribacter muris]